ncbi:putative oxidoreductase/dehydrogenase [Indibacter alkaliphilus LW1]|uniref:Oxidoreductase/dehydrogenase n=1 Tax=Indibacter alkaliphilus (strain CCUG 57479 / KCTC 22604 / LW1) TaxID=1189612 RepID=S2DEZ8_INDAL|nr:SDR family oxidoreductase [Indibacter alkaliphilus]EOZ95570.1 putative oxidoreductase/dehydrogenase [Indibacter alkaliphilus LW1]
MSRKIVWITGATSGIGEALAKLYLSKGHQIIVSARKVELLEKIKTESRSPKDVFVLPLDLNDSNGMKEKVKAATQAFGRVDILINNGGISQRSLAAETSLEVDRKIMEVNFFGTVALSKALLPHFIDKKSGHFGVVSSLVGKFGSPYRTAYAASKHALHGFFDSLRAEHFKDNIGVTMICPGFIKTNVSINALTGNGSPLKEMDDAQAKGMSAEDCAWQIYKAIESKKEEVLIGGKEKYAVYLKRLFPSVFSRILRKAKVR